jgi:hypothetical protein
MNTRAAASMLMHFTRASRRGDALDNLVEILRSGTIRASTRMIRGKRPVVCLFDAPFNESRRLLVRNSRQRYQPFGIALDKRYAFRMGARPVIYMPLREAERMLKVEELWRVVAIDVDRAVPIDWTFEREWRALDDLAFPPHGAAALVETWREVDDLYERFAGEPPCAGVIPVTDLFGVA